MRDFRKLIAWQKAHALAAAVHAAAEQGEAGVAPGLRLQLLRAASSVPASLVEGCTERSETEFARYVELAIDSIREVQNQLILAGDVGGIHADAAAILRRDADEVARILTGLARATRQRLAGRGGRARLADGKASTEG
jgi:four helix bundle protein